MRDIIRDNIDNYVGVRARKEWGSAGGLFDAEAEIISRHFARPPARVLDMGCGGGRTTKILETMGYEVDAVDLSEDLVADARAVVTRSRVHLMDARELQFQDGSFDAVLFSFNGLDCVHPRTERLRVLAETFRVLRPGGVFYYSGHNGLTTWLPRPGDSPVRLLRRTRQLARAQTKPFSDRLYYLAYPDHDGTQVLYSALPHTHLAELRAHGFVPIAVYGSVSYRRGPHFLDNALGQPRLSSLTRLARFSLRCRAIHYVAQKIS